MTFFSTGTPPHTHYTATRPDSPAGGLQTFDQLLDFPYLHVPVRRARVVRHLPAVIASAPENTKEEEYHPTVQADHPPPPHPPLPKEHRPPLGTTSHLTSPDQWRVSRVAPDQCWWVDRPQRKDSTPATPGSKVRGKKQALRRPPGPSVHPVHYLTGCRRRPRFPPPPSVSLTILYIFLTI